uniref:Reverse transcriptase Ty1/copia-type domain-containing protein n=1 Tax=Tanacetum cinerariifolium TaxID=118510 RepID=A0A699IG14_TANCI|nr:hypothetical protein [Tanacetum cinerariifolium]
MKKKSDATSFDIPTVNTLNFFDTPYFPIKKPTKSLCDDYVETDSHGDSENSSALRGIHKDASDSDSTSLEDFNDATDRELVTLPYDDIIVEQSFTSEDNPNITNINSDQPNLKKSLRTSKLPTKLSNFVLDDKVKYGINKHVAAINEEIEALHTNETWDITELPLAKKPIGCKWIYKTKYKSTGEIKRFKARLVAKEYNQREGIDYDKTFSPVVKIVTVRCLISLVVNKGWKLFQLAVNNTFLYATLSKEVYMTLLPGPDISYAVHSLSQFMHAPLNSHLKLAFRILKYLKNSPGKGILISKNQSLTLTGYSDSDWAKCKATRRSVTGFKVFMGNSAITWKSKNQSIVSRSSIEAEYRALASITCEVMWLLNLFKDLEIKTDI